MERIGTGIVLFILSVICTLITEATIRSNNSTQPINSSWIIYDIDSYLETSNQNRELALISQQCLSALSVLRPSLYERTDFWSHICPERLFLSSFLQQLFFSFIC